MVIVLLVIVLGIVDILYCVSTYYIYIYIQYTSTNTQVSSHVHVCILFCASLSSICRLGGGCCFLAVTGSLRGPG